MKERPIIVSTKLIPAILDGTKTQTRRVIKPQPRYGLRIECPYGIWRDYKSGRVDGVWAILKCPYQVGDRLWVKEAWAAESKFDWTKPSKISADSEIFYLADGWDFRYAVGKTRPPIHMPRWASRILLEITRVRAERLQDISEEDAKAEGVEAIYTEIEGITWYRPAFTRLWNSLNAKRGYGWEVNPFVWVIEFRRVDSG